MCMHARMWHTHRENPFKPLLVDADKVKENENEYI